MRTWDLTVLVALLLATSPASATQIMTFDGIPFSSTASVWVEDGITATGGVGWSSTAGAPHLDWAGTQFPRAIEFATGSLFEALSVDIRPSRSDYCSIGFFPFPPGTVDESCTSLDEPIDYIWVSGVLDGDVVGSVSLYRPSGSPWETVPLDFGPIDLLRVEVRNYLDLGLPGGCTVPACGHFNLDNVVIDAVPEPGSALLVIVGLLGFGLRTRAPRTRHRS